MPAHPPDDPMPWGPGPGPSPFVQAVATSRTVQAALEAQMAEWEDRYELAIRTLAAVFPTRLSETRIAAYRRVFLAHPDLMIDDIEKAVDHLCATARKFPPPVRWIRAAQEAAALRRANLRRSALKADE